MLHRSLLIVAAAILTFLIPAPVSAQETYQNAEHGFSLSIPIGWKKIDPAKVAGIPIQKPAGGDARYLAGYSRNGSLQLPYILIEWRRQPWSLDGARASDIAERLNLTPIDDLIDQQLFTHTGRYKGNDLSPAAFDRRNGRIFVEGPTTGIDGKPVYIRSVNFLGATDFIRVTCYKPDDQSKMLDSAFNTALGSFAFQPGAAWDPPLESRRSRRGRIGSIGGPMGGVAIVALVLYYAFRRWTDSD